MREAQLGQRNRNTPEKRQHQQIDQRHAGPRSRDHVLEAEGPVRRVGKHHEDEIEEAGFAKSGRRFVGDKLVAIKAARVVRPREFR
jgi:hypothetical protein